MLGTINSQISDAAHALWTQKSFKFDTENFESKNVLPKEEGISFESLNNKKWILFLSICSYQEQIHAVSVPVLWFLWIECIN